VIERSLHILVVDDFKASGSLVQNLVKEFGYTADLVMSGAEALEYLKNNVVDLILLDILLPDVDGYGICKIIRADHQYDDIPIICMTTQREYESIVKGFEVGAQDYITKPFGKEVMLARINNLLTVRRQKLELADKNKELNTLVAEKTKRLNEALLELQSAYVKESDINEQLRALDQAKLDFLSIISHEIRTPLNSILGFSELLKDFEGSDDYVEAVTLLQSSAQRLEEFAQKAYLISELSLGKYKLMLTNVDVLEVVENIVDRLGSAIEAKHAHVSIKIYPKSMVWADATLLDACLYNVIENACRYVNENGFIIVSLTEDDGKSCIGVMDEGDIFPTKILNDPYSLFSKGEQFINKNPGNGLYIVKSIMDKHKGDVKLTNIEAGASVQLLFPKNGR